MGTLRAALAAGTVLALWLCAAAPARAEDRVTIRGAYFREHSTRVVQPMLQINKDLPAGFDVAGHFLVDAITSASIAAGTTQDSIFTELRKETGVAVGKTIGWSRLGLAVRHSREPDYVSTTGGLSFSQGFWENSGTIAVNLAYGKDVQCPNLNFNLDVYFGSVAYTQALSPTLVAQVGYELAALHGFVGNCYIQVPNLGRERPPTERRRHVGMGRIAKHLAGWGTTFQLHYRFYVDDAADIEPEPWGLVAHTIEARLYQELTLGLEVRLGYRGHSQGAADFWCNTDPLRGGRTDCYSVENATGGGARTPDWFSGDAKLGPLATHVAELKLTWDARPLQSVPVLGWFAAGAFEISYGRYIQNTRYAGAHLLQTGYSLAF